MSIDTTAHSADRDSLLQGLESLREERNSMGAVLNNIGIAMNSLEGGVTEITKILATELINEHLVPLLGDPATVQYIDPDLLNNIAPGDERSFGPPYAVVAYKREEKQTYPESFKSPKGEITQLPSANEKLVYYLVRLPSENLEQLVSKDLSSPATAMTALDLEVQTIELLERILEQRRQQASQWLSIINKAKSEQAVSLMADLLKDLHPNLADDIVKIEQDENGVTLTILISSEMTDYPDSPSSDIPNVEIEFRWGAKHEGQSVLVARVVIPDQELVS
ncbi:hypothetical protein HN748_05170 [Candidatus Peregrinibacteria bacterium]|jgi:hypothetical protein|nr:hypothetical protein [Candidatus Peregrinibacteria bacterium]MBT7484708.1 hypothetical protein [Candidatus Peregrinibacteria bacterium]MBT7703600.1 hypothetical protein [Candidatus Peregrinibacteria bacterium]